MNDYEIELLNEIKYEAEKICGANFEISERQMSLMGDSSERIIRIVDILLRQNKVKS